MRVFRMDLMEAASKAINLAKDRLENLQGHEITPELAVRILTETARVRSLLTPQQIHAERMTREKWEAVFSKLADRDGLTGQAREDAVKNALDIIDAMEGRE